VFSNYFMRAGSIAKGDLRYQGHLAILPRFPTPPCCKDIHANSFTVSFISAAKAELQIFLVTEASAYQWFQDNQQPAVVVAASVAKKGAFKPTVDGALRGYKIVIGADNNTRSYISRLDAAPAAAIAAAAAAAGPVAASVGVERILVENKASVARLTHVRLPPKKDSEEEKDEGEYFSKPEQYYISYDASTATISAFKRMPPRDCSDVCSCKPPKKFDAKNITKEWKWGDRLMLRVRDRGTPLFQAGTPLVGVRHVGFTTQPVDLLDVKRLNVNVTHCPTCNA
jgi:hypothetical protein